MKNQNEVSTYIENVAVLILGALLISLPLVFTTLTTDAFVLPKQILLTVAVLLLVVLSGAKMLSDKTVRISKTPFDLPVFIFSIVALLSSIISINRVEALISVIPIALSAILFYLVVNVAKNKLSILFLISCFLSGASLVALVAAFSFFKIYVLPFPFAKTQTFNLFGSLLDQAMYLSFALPVGLMLCWKGIIGSTKQGRAGIQRALSSGATGSFLALVASIAILLGLVVTGYQLATSQKPILLPFETGFQIAFATISQDVGRVAQSFLLGSGYGTFYADFTRFKQATFNLNQTLWSFTFFRSSSLILELLATTGILGFISFLYLLFTMVKEAKTSFMERRRTASGNPLSIGFVLVIAAAFLLPFSPIIMALFFILSGLFAAAERLIEGGDATARYYDVELHFVAFKKGILPLATMPVTTPMRYTSSEQTLTKFLPVSLFTLFILFSGLLGLGTYQYVASDTIFQHSLIAASQNNGLQTYTDQTASIKMFPYRDGYYRVASQTDMALANALAASVPAGSSPSAQIQQNITILIQQSIANARTATDLSPQNALNWQNLAAVYRALIGYGQNAEQFAVATAQQAIALNPNDPQGYINLGGIYYQLKLWDQAQQQFQIAVNLKPDFANAYYNLGHALEEKGDLQNAYTSYLNVKSLVTADKEAVKKIDAEIEALKQKAGAAQTQQPSQTQSREAGSGSARQPLEVNKPANQLPEQKQPVKIPSPAVTAAPSPSATPSNSPTPTPAQ